jgi:hypothetical protein
MIRLPDLILAISSKFNHIKYIGRKMFLPMYHFVYVYILRIRHGMYVFK